MNIDENYLLLNNDRLVDENNIHEWVYNFYVEMNWFYVMVGHRQSKPFTRKKVDKRYEE